MNIKIRTSREHWKDLQYALFNVLNMRWVNSNTADITDKWSPYLIVDLELKTVVMIYDSEIFAKYEGSEMTDLEFFGFEEAGIQQT